MNRECPQKPKYERIDTLAETEGAEWAELQNAKKRPLTGEGAAGSQKRPNVFATLAKSLKQPEKAVGVTLAAGAWEVARGADAPLGAAAAGGASKGNAAAVPAADPAAGGGGLAGLGAYGSDDSSSSSSDGE